MHTSTRACARAWVPETSLAPISPPGARRRANPNVGAESFPDFAEGMPLPVKAGSATTLFFKKTALGRCHVPFETGFVLTLLLFFCPPPSFRTWDPGAAVSGKPTQGFDFAISQRMVTFCLDASAADWREGGAQDLLLRRYPARPAAASFSTILSRLALCGAHSQTNPAGHAQVTLSRS